MAEVIIVVGMHRSGTSCLAGSLESAGLHLGDVITAAPHNAKGNRENRRIMDLHEAVLRASGGAWDDPPAHVAWSDEHRGVRDEVIAGYAGHVRWGFKDPRTLLTLAGWLEVLPAVRLVGTFRHPSGVVASLMRRNGGTEDRWLALWAAYNERLIELYDRHHFPVVDFDRDGAAYGRSLGGVFEALGLPGAEAPFFATELRHHPRHDALPLPERVRGIYEALRHRAVP